MVLLHQLYDNARGLFWMGYHAFSDLGIAGIVWLQML
jgi:hypothetical protein